MNQVSAIAEGQLVNGPELRVLLDRMGELVERVRSLPDDEGQRVHLLFAELYYVDMQEWAARVERDAPDGFMERVSFHFFDRYVTALGSFLNGSIDGTGPAWQAYNRRAGRCRMADGIWTHLFILIAGVRGHIVDDLGMALADADREWQSTLGANVDREAQARFFLNEENRAVFAEAAIRYIDLHSSQQRGYRHFMLRLFRVAFSRTGWLWWPVISSWRERAWNTYLAEVSAEQSQAA